MPNRLLSSFTYLPNFIIWLPSFSFPWLRFLDFSHFVKKVSKPSIFCEIIFVSKRTMVILIRMFYCTAFFKAKNFVILFFLSFVWLITGEGISFGVIFPGRGEFSQGSISSGKKFWRVIFTGGSFHRGNINRGGVFIGGQFSWGQFSRGRFSWYHTETIEYINN